MSKGSICGRGILGGLRGVRVGFVSGLSGKCRICKWDESG